MAENQDTEKVSLEMEAGSKAKDNIIRDENNTVNATDEKPPDPPKRDQSLEKGDVLYATVEKKKNWNSFRKPYFVYKQRSSESWMSCLKISLIVFNLFIWTLGAAITALGIWVKTDGDFSKIQDSLDVKEFTTAGWILIFVGIVIMLIGFVGCYGAIASQVCMLIIFSVVVCIVLVMEVVVVALVWTTVTSKNTQEDIKLKAKRAMINMAKNDKQREFINLVQSKLHCCGIEGPDDYTVDQDHSAPIPDSCTDPKTGGYYEQGCYTLIMDYLKGKAAAVGGVAAAVLILQVGAIALTICMICSLW